MKATELRIGNIVLVENIEQDGKYKGNFSEVIADSSTISGCELCPNRVKPIPLTEEWLDKFGFERNRDPQIVSPNRVLWFVNMLEFNEGFYCNETGLTVYYVHQLQNLYYALTGEELKG